LRPWFHRCCSRFRRCCRSFPRCCQSPRPVLPPRPLAAPLRCCRPWPRRCSRLGRCWPRRRYSQQASRRRLPHFLPRFRQRRFHRFRSHLEEILPLLLPCRSRHQIRPRCCCRRRQRCRPDRRLSWSRCRHMRPRAGSAIQRCQETDAS
jgi:hypothetical protein